MSEKEKLIKLVEKWNQSAIRSPEESSAEKEIMAILAKTADQAVLKEALNMVRPGFYLERMIERRIAELSLGEREGVLSA